MIIEVSKVRPSDWNTQKKKRKEIWIRELTKVVKCFLCFFTLVYKAHHHVYSVSVKRTWQFLLITMSFYNISDLLICYPTSLKGGGCELTVNGGETIKQQQSLSQSGQQAHSNSIWIWMSVTLKSPSQEKATFNIQINQGLWINCWWSRRTDFREENKQERAEIDRLALRYERERPERISG